jgi:DNA-binding transcriptional LysR family regulator
MIDSLHAFLAVVDTGNLSRAARRLDLAVSSVSRQLDALEHALGARLLVRGSRAVVLTDAGERFVPRARRVLAELAEARDSMTDGAGEPRGILTVTAPRTFGSRHVVPAALSFMERYAQLEVELNITDEVLDLGAERIDVAVRAGVLPDSGLYATALAPYRRIACAGPAYLARHGRPATPDELPAHRCITFLSRPRPFGWWSFAGVNGGRPLAVRGPLRTDDIQTMVDAAIRGAGIVHLASWLVADAVAAGLLVPLFGSAFDLPGPAIHAVRMDGRSHPVKARLFIAHLQESIGTPPHWEKVFDDTGFAPAERLWQSENVIPSRADSAMKPV